MPSETATERLPFSAREAACRTPAPAARRKSSLDCSEPRPTTTIRGPPPAAGRVRLLSAFALAPSETAISPTETPKRFAKARRDCFGYFPYPCLTHAHYEDVSIAGDALGDGERGKHPGWHDRNILQ